ncbi:hypothetical protein [Adlercreutzia equolifaciens]|uniref:hypothetical protein n=1 Tax=Adlercreutzia equolifaciens TaxID=446660 RepID=UPI00266EE818|nr:hypothetical protein [Adlercreutzia equolifaciens]
MPELQNAVAGHAAAMGVARVVLNNDFARFTRIVFLCGILKTESRIVNLIGFVHRNGNLRCEPIRSTVSRFLCNGTVLYFVRWETRNKPFPSHAIGMITEIGSGNITAQRAVIVRSQVAIEEIFPIATRHELIAAIGYIFAVCRDIFPYTLFSIRIYF